MRHKRWRTLIEFSGGTSCASDVQLDQRDTADRKGVSLSRMVYALKPDLPPPSSPFPVVANQPQNDVIYVANVIPCGAQFAANYTNTNTNATKSSSVTQSMKPYSHAIVIIVVLGVLLNFM